MFLSFNNGSVLNSYYIHYIRRSDEVMTMFISPKQLADDIFLLMYAQNVIAVAEMTKYCSINMVVKSKPEIVKTMKCQ